MNTVAWGGFSGKARPRADAWGYALHKEGPNAQTIEEWNSWVSASGGPRRTQRSHLERIRAARSGIARGAVSMR